MCFGPQLFVVSNKDKLFGLWTKGRKNMAFKDLTYLLYQDNPGYHILESLHILGYGLGSTYNNVLLVANYKVFLHIYCAYLL
jgi:hypothetical protein